MKSEAERESELRSRPIPSLQVDIAQLASDMVHNPKTEERVQQPKRNNVAVKSTCWQVCYYSHNQMTRID